jgi:CheY-like chemotaxis protein
MKCRHTNGVKKHASNSQLPTAFSSEQPNLTKLCRRVGLMHTVTASPRLVECFALSEQTTHSGERSDLFDLIWIIRGSLRELMTTKRIPCALGDVHLIDYRFPPAGGSEPAAGMIVAVVSQAPNGAPLLHLSLLEELNLDAEPPRVLLLEADEDIRWLMIQLLEAAGYTVTAAATGSACLALAQMTVPHIIALDVDLPDGADGYRLCLDLTAGKNTSHIPVLLCSGRVDLPERATQAGASATLAKPDEVLQLTERLRRLLKLRAFQ